MPPEVVEDGKRFEIAPGLDRELGILFDLGAEGINTPFMDKIFEAGMATVSAVTKVALNRHNCLHHRGHLGKTDKAKMLGQQREGFLFTVGTTEAPTNTDVKTFESALLVGNNHQPQILGVEVDGIIARNRDRRFEFAR